MKMKKINNYKDWCIIWTIIFSILLLCTSCTTTKYVPIKEIVTETKTEIIRDTVVQIKLPEESVTNYTNDTISTIETSIAKSTAEIIDGKLKHTLTNKNINLESTIQVKDSIIYKTIYKDVPYEVKVEKIPSWFIPTIIAISLLLIFIIFIKFKNLIKLK